MQVFSASRVFNGEQWMEDQAVVIENGLVKSLTPITQLPANGKHFSNCFIIPAFIDVQVYGADKILFSLYPKAETLQRMNEVFLQAGTIRFLPTLATNTTEVFKKAIDAVRSYWQKDGKGVHGLHLEGPWINEEKRGAHLKELVSVPTIEEVRDLLDYGRDVIKMITLAPEQCSREIIDLIRSRQVIVSAGHSSAGFQKATESFENGISAVTHLYNAMSGLHHREPGLVGATFSHPAVMASIIPDGHHVDYAAIAIAKKIMANRLFAITDAVTETTEGPYRHQPAGDKFECNGVLSGSALTMHQAFCNLVREVGVEIGEASRMCSLYPAQLIGMQSNLGRIAPGYSGQLLVLNEQLEIVHRIF